MRCSSAASAAAPAQIGRPDRPAGRHRRRLAFLHAIGEQLRLPQHELIVHAASAPASARSRRCARRSETFCPAGRRPRTSGNGRTALAVDVHAAPPHLGSVGLVAPDALDLHRLSSISFGTNGKTGGPPTVAIERRRSTARMTVAHDLRIEPLQPEAPQIAGSPDPWPRCRRDLELPTPSDRPRTSSSAGASA